MATRTLPELIAQFQQAIPLLKPAGANVAAIQNQINQALANIRSQVAASGGNLTGRLSVPQPGNFTPPTQGFTAIGRQQRAPHPPSNQTQTNLMNGFHFARSSGLTPGSGKQ